MRKRIVTVGRDIVFLLMCVGLFVRSSYLVRPVYIENNVARSLIAGFYAEKKGTLDVIYTGGSSAFTYFNPVVAYNEKGFTSYDFAYNGSSSDAYIFLVKEALKTQQPKVYILDLRAFELRPDMYAVDNYKGNVIPGINSMDYSLNRLNAIMDLVPRKDRLSMLFDISMYHDRWKCLDKDSFVYSSNRAKQDKKGYWTINETKKVNLVKCMSNSIDECADISEESLEVFEKLCEFCSRQDFETLFIVPPYAYDKPEEKIMVYNAYRSIIDKYGLDYLNCNDCYDEIGMDGETDYYNENHTNPIGAYKYSIFLSRYLAEKYNLPDHRDDKAYSEWDVCYNKYLDESSEVVDWFGLDAE